MFREAFRVAMAPRRGPVQLNLPRDVLSGTAEFPEFQAPEAYRSQTVPAAAADAISQAAQMLRGAQRPVIVAGGGIKNTGGHEAALALAEALNAPIITAPGHGDAIPFGHPLNAGQMGPRGNVVASRLAKEADVILALGTRLGFNSTFYSYDNISEAADIIQVELEPTAIGRYFPVALGIWADAPTAALQLRDASPIWRRAPKSRPGPKPTARTHRLSGKTRRRRRDRRPSDPAVGPLQGTARRPAEERRRHHGCGHPLSPGDRCLNYWEPPCLFTPLDFGLVGFSFACGLGVKVGGRTRPWSA